MNTDTVIDRVEHNQRVDFLIDVIERKTNDVEVWKSAWDTSRLRCSAMEDKVRDLEADIEAMRSENRDLKDLADDLDGQVSTLEKMNNGLRTTCDDLREERDKLIPRERALEERAEQAESGLNKANQEVYRLNGEVLELQDNIEFLESENKNLEQKVDELIAELERMLDEDNTVARTVRPNGGES